MRIDILTPGYLPTTGGGIATFYRHLLPRLAAAGHEVRVFQGSGRSAAAASSPHIIDGVRTECLDVARFKRHASRFAFLSAMPGLQRQLAGAWALAEQARESGEADIIEACDWGLLFIPPILSGTTPVVAQMHGSIGQIDSHDPMAGEETQGVLIRLIESAVLRRATAIQCSSQANAAFWRRQTGASVETLAPAWRAISDTGACEATSRGLVLGRVQKWKGPDILCRALTLLGGQSPAIDWVGPDTAAGVPGTSLSAELALNFPDIWGARINHLPPVSPERAASLQCAARFNVVPSTWDVFNFTCVEAMSSGRPVICSSGAGASELIEDGVNGFLFESGNPASLAAALERTLLLNQTQQTEIGTAARETVRRMLDPERIAAQRLAAYQAAIAAFVPQAPMPSDWLAEACMGRDQSVANLSFLDHLPLRRILSYGGRRLTEKLVRRAPG